MQGRSVAFLALITLIAALIAAGYYVNGLERSVRDLSRAQSELEAQITELRLIASSTAAKVAAPPAPRPQPAVAKSADQQLQDAVSRVTPAVVSIVESREVPLLQISYENPFGDDPFFRGFGMQVPVYKQVGTTTQKVSAGTGFLVRSNGYIITNKHVVPDTNATYTVLLSSGRQVNGTVTWRSQSEDLAVLKIPGTGYASVPLGDSSSLKLGESVFAVGNALGEYSNSVSVGIISGLNRSITAATNAGDAVTLQDVIQTDAAINPGNSGGPLVNFSGQVVGVNVATVQGSQSIGFSVPINKVKNALAALGI